jgi:hypothetical protein
MGPADYSRKLLGLARAVHQWLGTLTTLDDGRRDRVAKYADEIARTLQRATDGLARLEADPLDKGAQRVLIRELGRIAGYIETIVDVLDHHLDGRKLAGVKRRLEQLALHEVGTAAVLPADRTRIERLLAAEGYFRALADGLRA